MFVCVCVFVLNHVVLYLVLFTGMVVLEKYALHFSTLIRFPRYL